MNRMFFRLWSLCATCFFMGYIPLLPGTAASLLTSILLWVWPLSLEAYMLALGGLFFGGWYSSAIYTAKKGVSDPSEIVIDEVVGMMVALAFLPHDKLLYIGAFLLFRFFDITKLFPVNRCERLSWVGLAVMADDVMAGIMAWCCMMTFYLLSR